MDEIIQGSEAGQSSMTSLWSFRTDMTRLLVNEAWDFPAVRNSGLRLQELLLKNPKILVLDDATSAVDMETEHEIQSGFQEVMRRKNDFYHRTPDFLTATCR